MFSTGIGQNYDPFYQYTWLPQFGDGDTHSIVMVIPETLHSGFVNRVSFTLSNAMTSFMFVWESREAGKFKKALFKSVQKQDLKRAGEPEMEHPTSEID